jgi:serine/threonine protein phosphatase PrpC
LKILSAGLTDIGRKRGHNEDSLGVFDGLGLYVVADGMGGHAAGEVASKMAVDILKGVIAKPSGPAAELLPAGIKLANEEIARHAARRLELRGMGTTIVAALVDGDKLHLAHVGDSRAYVYTRENRLVRLTTDHSLVFEMVLAGQLTEGQARTHPMRNIITRALGSKPEVQVDISRRSLAPGEIYLLCSDGLTGMLTDDDIAYIILQNRENLPGLVRELIHRANEAGGDDNITAVVFRAV